MSKNLFLLPLTFICVLAVASNLYAEQPEELILDKNMQYAQNDLDLGSEYSDYNKEKYRGGSKGGASRGSANNGHDTFTKVLLYLPNRVLDFLDIFRMDIGVGPSVGGVVRVTKYGQAGARFLMPVSLRAGLRGRRLPIFLEHSSEMGIGPAFLSSDDREPSILEVGVGLDFFIAGAYAGISIDSIWDALAGIGGFDPADDDL